jgi:LysR family transcriptional regulator, nitrogen assimilation regulatory protein
MDLKQLSYFMLIYEEGSFSKAASKAGVVQPALSSQVRKLELEFGVTLFVRTSRGVEPTAAGNLLYDLASSITKSIADAKHKLADLVQSEQVGGTIKVGLPPSLARGIFSPVMTRFTADYPKVEIRMIEGFSGMLTEWVREGRIDFAIGAVPVDAGGLRQRKIHRDQIVLVSGQPLAGPQFTPCRLDRIPNLKLILPSRGNSFGEAVRELINKGEIVVKTTVEVDGTSGGLELARSTDWAGLTPFVAVHADVETNNMCVHPIVSPALSWDLFLLYDEKKPLAPAANRFIEVVERELQNIRATWAKFTDKYGVETSIGD